MIFIAIAIALNLASPGAILDYESLKQQARTLSTQPFQPPDTNRVPENLKNLSYVAHKAIHFRQERALWRSDELPFNIEFFHPGYVHQQPVEIYEIYSHAVRKIPFDPSYFRYPGTNLNLSSDIGFAGFRITSPVENFGEVAAFVGASYFRMIGRGQAFGTSARGLALDTASHEEFPVFRDFWLRKPGSKDDEMVVYAIMDSPSVTGAFQFNITPGVDTEAKVMATFYPRKFVKAFGIAPLTTMFLHDENTHSAYVDFRPAVHDADGLQMHNGKDEWLWRPFDKGKMMRINAYQDKNPKGFGFMQRDRTFEHYQDLIAKFERRPSVWVETMGDWGKGAVELVQIPSHLEFSDNVVAFWVPEKPPRPGEELSLNYKLHWTTNSVVPTTLGHVCATRVGRVVVEPETDHPNLRFVIDFDGERMQSLQAKDPLQAVIISSDPQKMFADTVLKNPINGTWRLVIEMKHPDKVVDLRAFLKHNGAPVTETWNYTWQP